jgi:predicted NBD/HSP70 family sugar kinase
VLAALAEVGGWLSIGLGSLVNLVAPGAIVLGGYLAPLAEWLVEDIEREVRMRVLGARWGSCSVLVSTLGEEAAVRGAAAFVLHEILADPGSVRGNGRGSASGARSPGSVVRSRDAPDRSLFDS